VQKDVAGEVGGSGERRGAVAQRRARRGPRFTHTFMVLQAATAGEGVALATRVLGGDLLSGGRLVRPVPRQSGESGAACSASQARNSATLGGSWPSGVTMKTRERRGRETMTIRSRLLLLATAGPGLAAAAPAAAHPGR
jgi:hypothetical protein